MTISMSYHAVQRLHERHDIGDEGRLALEDLIEKNQGVINLRKEKSGCCFMAVLVGEEWIPVVYDKKCRHVVTVYPTDSLNRYEHQLKSAKKGITFDDASRPISSTAIVARYGTKRNIQDVPNEELELEISCLEEIRIDADERGKMACGKMIADLRNILWWRETDELCSAHGIKNIADYCSLLKQTLVLASKYADSWDDADKQKVEVISRSLTGINHIKKGRL